MCYNTTKHRFQRMATEYAQGSVIDGNTCPYLKPTRDRIFVRTALSKSQCTMPHCCRIVHLFSVHEDRSCICHLSHLRVVHRRAPETWYPQVPTRWSSAPTQRWEPRDKAVRSCGTDFLACINSCHGLLKTPKKQETSPLLARFLQVIIIGTGSEAF